MLCRSKAARAAAAEGILAAADSSSLSRGAADPFGAPSLDEAAVMAEAAEVGLLAAERLTALVVHNAGEAVTPAMKVWLHFSTVHLGPSVAISGCN